MPTSSVWRPATLRMASRTLRGSSRHTTARSGWQSGWPRRRRSGRPRMARTTWRLSSWPTTVTLGAANGLRAGSRRSANDGRTYTMAEFLQYYGDSWQSEWAQSYEVLDICAGLDHASCEAQPFKCQWSWTGDWTTSCVVKPLTSLVV